MFYLSVDKPISKRVCCLGTTTYQDDYAYRNPTSYKTDPHLVKNWEGMHKKCGLVYRAAEKYEVHDLCKATDLPEWIRPRPKSVVQCSERLLPLHVTAEQYHGIKANEIVKCEEVRMNRFYETSMSHTYPELYKKIIEENCVVMDKRVGLKC